MLHVGINVCEASSVLLVNNGRTDQWLGGSRFPHEALLSASEALDGDMADTVCLCSDEHDPERLLRTQNREIAWIAEKIPHKRSIKLSREFTQHDALAWAGRYYAADSAEHYLVMNTHGSYGEVISLYESNGGFDLQYRLHGLNNSLGMLARATLESIGKSALPDHSLYELSRAYDGALDKSANDMVSKIVGHVLRQRNGLQSKYDPLFTPRASNNARHLVQKMWEDVERFGYRKRVSLSESGYETSVAFLAQKALESLVVNFLESHGVRDVICVGSLFANMGIREALKDKVDSIGFVSADTGAIGMVYYNDRGVL